MSMKKRNLGEKEAPKMGKRCEKTTFDVTPKSWTLN